MPDKSPSAEDKRAIADARRARKQVPAAPSVTELTADEVWRRSRFEGLDFASTDDLEIFEGVVEQDRAVRAVEVGLAIHRKSYNVFVSGYAGTGRTTVVRTLLGKIAPKRPVPPDWLYLPNLATPDRPTAVSVPAGKGKELAKQIADFVESMVQELPKAFHAKEHQEKIQRTLNESLEKENKAFLELNASCEHNGFTVKATKNGLVTVPVVDGRAISTKEFADLPERARARIDKRRTKLEPLISAFLEKARDIQVETQASIQTLQEDLGRHVAGPRIAVMKKAWGKDNGLADFLAEVESDILNNVGRFLQDDDEEPDGVDIRGALEARYRVNVFVDNSETEGAPVIFENHPTWFNLFGKIEKRVEQGMFSTDLTMIRSGSIARASGGYLVIPTAELFGHAMVWEQLKSVLRNREVAIEDVVEKQTFVPTVGLRPEPIPVDVKVILIGPPEHYEVLFHGDKDFPRLFQVKADFDTEIRRSDRTEFQVARFIATSVRNEKLKAVSKDGIVALVEEASRLVGDQQHLTLRFNDIANLLLEADYYARKGRSKRITDKHVARAVSAREERASLLPGKMLDAMLEDQLLIDTRGEGVGRINGLAAITVGHHTFGKPMRISATTYSGESDIINVEREAQLAGSIHDKGVLILQGWLGSRFAQDGPLSLTVHLTIEQSYGYIDGDSASAAELFAVLSSLSGVPIRQDLAVTGSMNQHGQIQPIGGANEKIEGFFELCHARRLSGRQGVLIPAQNVRHLMLRQPVRKAIAAGKFHIYPMRSIEEGIELLTGMPAADLMRLAAARVKRFQEQDVERRRR